MHCLLFIFVAATGQVKNRHERLFHSNVSLLIPGYVLANT